MKKTVKILSLALVFIMCFGVINAFAKGKALSNDKFYGELPEGFEVNDSFGDDHYYINDSDILEYQGDIEIFVEGNILFPDGVKDTDIGVIKARFSKFYSVEETTEIEIEKAEKGNINGISACYIYGAVNSEEFIHAYILTTKENLYIVLTTGYDVSFEEEPEYFKEFMSSFLVNGTYYNGEKLTKKHDFSKAEHYIDALERDVLTENYDSYNSGVAAGAVFIILAMLFFPVITIVFLVLYLRTRKKLKEYKEFFGPIEQAKMAMRQHYMQNSPYQPSQYTGGSYSNVPNMNAYNGNQQPFAQPQYQPQYQPTQPAQTNLPPEMQEFQNNNENKI